MLKEFRDFAMRGNVVDLAIGVIIGAAFGKIVESLVNDIIMPIIGIAGKPTSPTISSALSSAVTATNLADARKKAACWPTAISSPCRQFPDRRLRAVPRRQGHEPHARSSARRRRRAAAAERGSRAADRDPRRARQVRSSTIGPVCVKTIF